MDGGRGVARRRRADGVSARDVVRENGQWDATLSVHRAPRSPRSHRTGCATLPDNYDTIVLTLSIGQQPAAPPERRGRGRREFVVRSPRPKTGWWGRRSDLRIVTAGFRSARGVRTAAARQHAQPRRGVRPHLAKAAMPRLRLRAEAHRADIGRVPETLPVAVAARVREQARACQRRRRAGRPGPPLHRSPRPAQLRAARATRSAPAAAAGQRSPRGVTAFVAHVAASPTNPAARWRPRRSRRAAPGAAPPSRSRAHPAACAWPRRRRRRGWRGAGRPRAEPRDTPTHLSRRRDDLSQGHRPLHAPSTPAANPAARWPCRAGTAAPRRPRALWHKSRRRATPKHPPTNKRMRARMRFAHPHQPARGGGPRPARDEIDPGSPRIYLGLSPDDPPRPLLRPGDDGVVPLPLVRSGQRAAPRPPPARLAAPASRVARPKSTINGYDVLRVYVGRIFGVIYIRQAPRRRARARAGAGMVWVRVARAF